MKTLGIWATMVALSLCSYNQPFAQKDLSASIAARNNSFAFDLYHNLKGEDGNVFFSPFSISTALSMTYAGAAETTAEQMMKTLHFGANDASFHAEFEKYLVALEKNCAGKVDLNIANRLWASQEYVFAPDFLELTRKRYQAETTMTNFSQDPEGSRVRINKWVEEQTKDKIKDLLLPGTISNHTRLVLTNAIYFKGNWAYQFSKDATAERPFTPTKGKAIQVPFMHLFQTLAYFQNDLFQAVKIPYDREGQSMVVLLPRKDQSLQEVENQLSQANFEAWLQSFSYEKVDLQLPKFKNTYHLSLKKQLIALGMKEPFEPFGANFSLMKTKDQPPLHISDVIHKAFIEVNEEGTEAAAATAVIMNFTDSAAPQPKPIFRFYANHPFVYFIVDEASGSILFMGKINNP